MVRAPLLLFVVACLVVLVVVLPDRERGARREQGDRVAIPSPPVETGRRELRGRVVVQGSGEPIEGVQVVVDDRDLLESDARGEFVVAASGPVSFRFFHSDYAAWRTHRSVERDSLVFELVAGLRVDGRVVTEGNDPVPGVLVTAGESQVHTDGRGRFESGGHPRGPIEVACREAEVVAEAGGAAVTLVVAGSFLHVRARDPEGQPVRGVRFSGAHIADGGEGWSDYALFERDPGEEVRVDLTKPGYLPVRLDWRPRSAAPGVAIETVVMHPRPANSLRIRVRNADGSEPHVAHFTLFDNADRALVQESVPLEEGKGRVAGVPSGHYLVRAHADRDSALGVSTGVRIRPGDDNEVRFDLPPGVRVKVRWTKYSVKYRLELRSETDPERRYWFGQYPGKALWGSSTRVPLGRYRLVELRLRDELRSASVELTAPGTETVDWSE